VEIYTYPYRKRRTSDHHHMPEKPQQGLECKLGNRRLWSRRRMTDAASPEA
jgi:hypothetical protein